MFKSLAIASLLATAAAATAQSTDAPPAPEQAPAPIVRSYQSTQAPQAYPNQGDPSQPYPGLGRAPMHHNRRPDDMPQITSAQPIPGVWVRSTSSSSFKTVSATPKVTEVRLDKGILNVTVHHPADHSEILVDLPGGQTSLLKDGLYTFNAGTNTVRVLQGEAAAFPDKTSTSEKGIKVKEDHQLAFTAMPAGSTDHIKSVEAYPYELEADLLPAGTGGGDYANVTGPGYGYDDGPYPYGGYGDYPYGYGYYGYPYGFYPYVGVGFGYGYYGGLHGGYYGGRGFRR